ncbi:NUDIX hydrolase [Macrococcus sp. DPC7161]|uniref:NUDIX hydrolase n=1 Tax=Macrococcus sp. DPC7161 TaxID=2507060 RepID=UPI00100C2EF5|nr:NUDIX domain-containing protein [Macrococcus sp. DPC7161]RXK17824.1 NUDIX domain-containing protein [Macrococcus sp. DPC7161]
MYEVKTEIKIIPDGFESVNAYFHRYVLRNYIELGAKLIGRWIDDDHTVIVEIWGFDDQLHYQNFFEMRKKTSHYQKSLFEKVANDKWIISKKEVHLTPTGDYFQPKYSVSASVYVENEEGEVLLVRSLHRSDTLELPGGTLDPGETLMDCAKREVKEEAGLDVEIVGLVYVAQNVSNGVISYVFHGKVVGGTPTNCAEETTDVAFYEVNDFNIDTLITRPHFKERLVESRKLNYQNMDFIKIRPYELLHRS